MENSFHYTEHISLSFLFLGLIKELLWGRNMMDSWPINDIYIWYLSIIHCSVVVSCLGRCWLIPCEINILTALKFWNHFGDLRSNFNVVVLICFPHPHLTACYIFKCISKLPHTDNRVWLPNYGAFHFLSQCCKNCNRQFLVLSVTVCLYSYYLHQFLSHCFVTILLVEVIPHKAAFLEPVFIRPWTCR